MSEPAFQSQSRSWSTQIAQRFQCELDSELADWFDLEVWKQTGSGQFRVGVSPDELLAPAPEVIWPGLMMCDLIPILGSDSGDWLCGVVGPSNRISHFVQWYHGGGDWIPWGNTLAQAILYDFVEDHLPGSKRRHAIAAQGDCGTSNSETDAIEKGPFVDWALRRMPAEVQQTVASLAESGRPRAQDPSLADVLIGNGIAEIAVRCQMIQVALQGSGWDEVAAQLAIRNQRDAGWLFDGAKFPPDVRRSLVAERPTFAPEQQDWALAEAHAVAVTNLDSSIAWAWDIAGYAANRRGDRETAIARYLKGVECSVYSDQSIRLHTHWTTPTAAKFSAAQIQMLAPEMVEASAYLRVVCGSDVDQRTANVADHWLELSAGLSGDEKLRSLTAAGWDVGMQPISAFGDLLDQIEHVARSIGQSARAAVAQAHRECLRDRYGL